MYHMIFDEVDLFRSLTLAALCSSSAKLMSLPLLFVLFVPLAHLSVGYRNLNRDPLDTPRHLAHNPFDSKLISYYLSIFHSFFTSFTGW